MAVSELQDGQPLTFEWLNALVREINSLTNSINKVEALDSIDIVGTNTANLKIEVAKKMIKKDSSDQATEVISFISPFKNPPIVVATVDQQKSTDSTTPIAAVASISSVTTTGFNCKVMLVVDKQVFNKTINNIGVTYIAIGDKA